MDETNNLRELIAQRKGPTGVRVVAVTSGKGGVGKTFISANFGYVAAAAGQRVLIVDADLGLANVELLYGISPRYHLGDLLDGKAPLQSVLAAGPLGIRILPGGSGLRGLTHLSDAQRMRLLSALDTIEGDFDLVIFDTGAGIGDNVVFFAGGAQEALVVLTTEPTSLSDAYGLVKTLCLSGGVENFSVVINQAPSEHVARKTFEKLWSITSRFLNARLRYVGSVPVDENVPRSVMSQEPVTSLFAASPASRAILGIAERMLCQQMPKHAAGGLKFLHQRILREAAMSEANATSEANASH